MVHSAGKPHSRLAADHRFSPEASMKHLRRGAAIAAVTAALFAAVVGPAYAADQKPPSGWSWDIKPPPPQNGGSGN